MIYDLDKRKTLSTLGEVMQFEAPFVSLMWDECAHGDGQVSFIYSGMGIYPETLKRLMNLQVRYDGKLLNFNRVRATYSRTGAYENPDDPTEETIIEEVEVVYE